MNDVYDMSVSENVFCAKRVLVDSIYRQANLEGIAITFAETQDILNDVNVKDLSPTEVSKVCCLRDGWKYLFNNLQNRMDLVFLEEIHELVARFDVSYQYLGVLRTEDVMISGTTWRPEIPNADAICAKLKGLEKIECVTERAIETGLYLMRLQPFKDGNKRIGSFAINKILISHGKGIFNVPVAFDGVFMQKLVEFYESNDSTDLKTWVCDNCIDGTTKKG